MTLDIRTFCYLNFSPDPKNIKNFSGSCRRPKYSAITKYLSAGDNLYEYMLCMQHIRVHWQMKKRKLFDFYLEDRFL